MINHISRRSPAFEDFLQSGRKSRFADLFITLDKVWPDGDPPAGDVARIFLRKPEAPFSTVTIEDTGEQEKVWTSFGTADWSEQIDLDVTSASDPRPDHAIGSRRLPGTASGSSGSTPSATSSRRPGTSCFMVEPEIYEFLDWIDRRRQFAGPGPAARGA